MKFVALCPALLPLFSWSAVLWVSVLGVPAIPATGVGVLLAAGLLLLGSGTGTDVAAGTESFPEPGETVGSGSALARWNGAVMGTLFLVTALGCVFLAWRMVTPPRFAGGVSGTGTVTLERPWGRMRALLLDLPQGRFLLFVSPFGGHREGDRLSVQGYAEPLERGNGSLDMRPFWWARGVRAVLPPTRFATRALPERASPPGAPFCVVVSCWSCHVAFGATSSPRGSEAGIRSLRNCIDGGDFSPSGRLGISCRSRGCSRLGPPGKKTSRDVPCGGACVGICPPCRSRAECTSCRGDGAAFSDGSVPRQEKRCDERRRGCRRRASVVRPWWFQDVGWRLSVTAVLVLGAYADLLGRRDAGKPGGNEESALSVARQGIAAGLLAWIATAGISASVFGPVPLAGALVNMVAIPVFAVLLPLASLAALPALLGIPGGEYAAGAMEWLFLWWEKGADGAATLLSASLEWSRLLGGGTVFLVTALVLGSCGIDRRRTFLISIILSGSIMAFFGA